MLRVYTRFHTHTLIFLIRICSLYAEQWICIGIKISIIHKLRSIQDIRCHLDIVRDTHMCLIIISTITRHLVSTLMLCHRSHSSECGHRITLTICHTMSITTHHQCSISLCCLCQQLLALLLSSIPSYRNRLFIEISYSSMLVLRGQCNKIVIIRVVERLSFCRVVQAKALSIRHPEVSLFQLP